MWGPRPQRAAVDAQEGLSRPESPSVDPNHTDVIQGPQIGAVVFGPTIAPCGCLDDTIDRLRDMVAGGMGQMEASKMIWGKR